MNNNHNVQYVIQKGSIIRKTNNQNDASHILLAKDDYRKMLESIEYLQEKLDRIQNNNNSVSLLNGLKMVESYKNTISELTTQNDNIIRECDRLKRINDTFLRQVKERANSDKKLFPKKQHSGYCLVSSNPKTYRYKDRNNIKFIDVYETIIQTYYSLEYAYEDIYSNIIFDLTAKTNKSLSIVEILGFNELNTSDDYTFIEYNPENIEYCFGLKLRANGRDNYWEAVLYHIKPLQNAIPANLRFNKNKKSKKTK